MAKAKSKKKDYMEVFLQTVEDIDESLIGLLDINFKKHITKGEYKDFWEQKYAQLEVLGHALHDVAYDINVTADDLLDPDA